jgi:hypothetical protein
MMIPSVVILVLIVAVLPFVALHLATRVQRARLDAVRRQIVVTDAIHAELGAVVAPTVRRRLGGRWQLLIPVPFDRPETIKRVIEVAYAAFGAPERADSGRFELVLSPQAKPVPRRDRAAMAACTSRGASVSWT